MAHLALLRIQPGGSDSPQPPDFDARLLLYSVKNADKSVKPGDATHLQRLEMMVLLARDLEQTCGVRNVAVALCQEPTFVGKSTVLRQFLAGRLGALSPPSDTVRAPQLFFLLGIDTLERLFAPRYYGSSEDAMKAAIRTFLSPSGDDSRIICARRSAGASYSPTETGGVLEEAAASDFIESGAISIVDIGNSDQSLSSSEIRESIRSSSGDWAHKVPPSIAEYINENILYK